MRKTLPLFTVLLALSFMFSSCKKDKIIPPPDAPGINDPHNDPFGSNYTQTTPWPRWIFTPWIWEGESTQESAIQIVNDYLANDIPVGAIIIDSPWETAYNTFDVDSTMFPNFKAMVDYMHSKNVRVFCWITSGIDTNCHPLYDYAKDRNYFMQENANSGPGVVEWWKPTPCSLVDFHNPDAVAWWKSLMDKTLAMGIDGWKCDGSDFLLYDVGNFKSYFYSPYLQGNIPSGRKGYSDKYYGIFNDYTREKLGNDRVVTCRPIDYYGYPSIFGLDFAAFAPKYMAWACWVGDQDGTFKGMKDALANMAFSSEYGYLSYGSDIGGYRTDPNEPPALGRSRELFIRWTQLGALCPIMENGGGGEHRPWMFDQGATDIYRTFAKLHVKLIPYMMKTAEEKFAADKSMCEYFNQTDYQYMLGDEIFVAPILAAGGDVSVKFPAGSNWVYLFNKSQVFTGGQTQTLNFPMHEYPVFLKEGSTLVTTLVP